MRSMAIILAVLVLLAALAGCGGGGGSSDISGNGTITLVQVEGGFYGIQSDDGQKYDPSNLQAPFQQNGMRVHFVVTPLTTSSPHQWGTAVTVQSMTAI